jgi:hypothetical protein
MDTTPTFTRETLRAALAHALEHAHTHNVTVLMRRYWADITALRELGLSWALLAAAFSEEGLSFTEEKLRAAYRCERVRRNTPGVHLTPPSPTPLPGKARLWEMYADDEPLN